MRLLACLALLMTVVLLVVSAYLRLHHSGIGCPDFPICYAQIGAEPAFEVLTPRNAYERIVAESSAPLAWAAPLHRAVASLLGLLVLALVYAAVRRGRYRRLCLALLGFTVFLALIGLRSGGLHHPSIVMGNLLGGFAMLGLLGWLVFDLAGGSPRHTETRIAYLRPMIITALALLCVQITIGGLTSANFAAMACDGFPDCNDRWWPDATLTESLKIFEAHEIDTFGIAIGGPERGSLQLLHRWVALLVFLAVAAVAGSSFFSILALRNLGLAALFLVAIEFAAGVAAVLTEIPISLAVAHNWVAALLLLVLLKMLALSRERPLG